jgi:hypothetical protein
MTKLVNINYFKLLSIGISLICASFNPASASNVPPFPRHEVNTGVRDGIQVNGSSHKQELAKYDDFLDNTTDIQRISYNGDGKVVNATLWLGGKLVSNLSKYGAITVAYGGLVDVDHNPLTGKFGVDYQKEIQWTINPAVWSDLLVEYSSSKNYRILESNRNDTNFFNDDNQSFVPISLDLKSLTLPSSFNVLYYALIIYNNSKMIVDLTNWISIPPPQYIFSTIPSPIEIRPGEDKIVGVQLLSNLGNPIKIINYVQFEDTSPIELHLYSDKLKKGQLGTAPASIRIAVPQGASVGKYTIPVLVNISTGSMFPSKVVNIGDLNISVPYEGYNSVSTNLTVSVIEALSFSERVKDFWSVYGALISLVGAGFAGGFSTLLFDYLKSRGKNRK